MDTEADGFRFPGANSGAPVCCMSDVFFLMTASESWFCFMRFHFYFEMTASQPTFMHKSQSQFGLRGSCLGP